MLPVNLWMLAYRRKKMIEECMDLTSTPSRLLTAAEDRTSRQTGSTATKRESLFSSHASNSSLASTSIRSSSMFLSTSGSLRLLLLMLLLLVLLLLLVVVIVVVVVAAPNAF